MWTAKLIAAGLIALALAGAWASHLHSQREIGAAKVRAEYAEQQAEAEKLNTQRALEGEAYALKLLAAAERRAKVRDAQAATDALARQAVSDARAREDLEYAIARESPALVGAGDRLRAHVDTALAVPGGDRLPAGPGVPASAPTAASTESAFQRWLGRISPSTD